MKILLSLMMILSFSSFTLAQDYPEYFPSGQAEDYLASDEINPSYEEPVFERGAIDATSLREEQEFSSEDLSEEWSSSSEIAEEEDYIE